MLKRLRKSSGTVTLVLIGLSSLAGCGDDERRDVYATKEDCLADWGNKPEDCTPATDSAHAARGHYYGPLYAAGGFLAGNAWNNRSATSSRAIGSTQVASSGGTTSSSRGGFGSTGRSSSSSSGG